MLYVWLFMISFIGVFFITFPYSSYNVPFITTLELILTSEILFISTSVSIFLTSNATLVFADKYESLPEYDTSIVFTSILFVWNVYL